MKIVRQTPAAPDGTALGILRIPFAFTQDRILRSGEFVAAANARDLAVRLDDLQELHELGILLPLFRVDDEQVVGRRIECAADGRSDLSTYAAAGQLRDPASEGFSRWWPYQRPVDAPTGWWDGYYFSPWQLLDVESALVARQFVANGDRLYEMRKRALQARRRLLAFCALAPRHYPLIWGQTSLSGQDFDDFRDAQYDIDDAERLTVAGFLATDLRSWAEQLLGHARTIDPAIELWPLLRYGRRLTWTKLKGKALLAVEHRIAAELLLRAHERLAELGELDPLPTLPRQGWRQLLHDRISVRDDSADSLDRALGAFGLSPYPRVLLLLEGQTERIHAEALLEEFGLGGPDQVRVHITRGSQSNPQMLAEYVVSPRMGPALGDRQLIDATPTALFVAMDPENNWTNEQVENRRLRIQSAIRDEVERQGAVILPNELDILVQIMTWGDQTYELANFTDTQLADALTVLAEEQQLSRPDAFAWHQALIAHLQSARMSHKDIKIVLQKMRMREDKPRLAKLLLPVLLDIIRSGEPLQDSGVPVLHMLDRVHGLYAQLSGSGYSLGRPTADL